MDAIRIYTMNSAYSGFEERIKGSIEVGKIADLVILTKDPLTVAKDEIQNIEAEMTIIGGKIVYQKK
jgi:predicted amidohydrolase YtcJ